jgi:3-oxoacyl-[acyl-carrier protein] reductase
MSEPPVVLITGTSRGIGNHLARHFLDGGSRVVGCSRGDFPDLEHERYAHRVVDVRSEPDVVELFGFIRTTYGRLDVAINNAALNPTLSLVALTPATAATDTLAANVLGPFLVCREAVKLMARRKFGRIVNLGSMATRHEVRGEALYTASKAALNAFTRVLAKEVAAQGITCNVVAPSAVETELSAAVDRDALREVLARNAIPELGSEADVAAAIDWLIKPESSAVTGQIVYLGGA